MVPLIRHWSVTIVFSVQIYGTTLEAAYQCPHCQATTNDTEKLNVHV